MKFYNKILAAAAAATITLGGLTSCDYLDVQPEVTLPEESVDYTEVENMYAPVSGMYATLRNNGMHWVINMMTVIRDGDVWSGRIDDQGDLVNIGEKYVYGSYWGFQEMWNQYYGMIKTANSTLQSLDAYAENLTTDAQRKDYRSYCGEVRILRAYAYYRLAQAFGAVTILESNDQTNMRRSTRNAVLRYALEDCKYAKENCYEMVPGQMAHPGAYSAYTAAALGAKCALILEDWATVESLTSYVINSGKFQLYDDYYQLFKTPGKLCSESLMECQSTYFGLGSGESILPGAFFSSVGPNMESADGTRSTGGWNFIGYQDSFVKWAEDRGETVRATTSFLKGGENTPSGDFIKMPGNNANTHCWNGKWYMPYDQIPEGRNDYGGDNNVRILRYSEVLLMNAEALVRQSKSGADTPFNLVRTRAKMPTITGVTLNDILDERRMELCCEWGTRYEDLVRCGLAQQVLGSKGWSVDKTYFPVPTNHLADYPELREDPIE